jgi:hypothetical protein
VPVAEKVRTISSPAVDEFGAHKAALAGGVERRAPRSTAPKAATAKLREVTHKF